MDINNDLEVYFTEKFLTYCTYGVLPLVKETVKNGADVKKYGYQGALNARENGHYHVLDYLQEIGVITTISHF